MTKELYIKMCIMECCDKCIAPSDCQNCLYKQAVEKQARENAEHIDFSKKIIENFAKTLDKHLFQWYNIYVR